MAQNLNNQRISFASSKTLLEYPDFLEVQLKSFKDFFQLDTTPENRRNEGLFKVFQELTPGTISSWSSWTISSTLHAIR